MSHIVEIQTQIKDPEAIRAACRRLQLPEPTHGTARLFSGQATGTIVQLPGWQYPVVCDTATGQLKYDNFNGHWGEQAHLDRFLQMYAVEKGSNRSETLRPRP
jgi:hypothetical protein